MKVPDILLSSNHDAKKTWREQKMFERTINRRIDLIINVRSNKKIIK